MSKQKRGNDAIPSWSGQNGYGKTTLFDAIELLITGNIQHFNSQLLNRGIVISKECIWKF